jgi:hypothetical protein
VGVGVWSAVGVSVAVKVGVGKTGDGVTGVRVVVEVRLGVVVGAGIPPGINTSR